MARKPSLRIAVGLAATVTLIGAGLALDPGSAPSGRPRSGPMRLVRGAGRPPGSYVRGSSLYRPGQPPAMLRDRVRAPLVGPLAPVAVRSADGRLLAYNTWAEPRALDTGLSLSRQGVGPGEPVGTPSLRVYDESTGRDFLLERGSYSAAWRRDGAVAYVRGLSPAFKPGQRYLSEVVVRPSLQAAGAVWSAVPAHYVVYGWAGEHLIVYRVGEDEEIDTLALDGPGRVRLLAAGSVVALSPDGERVFVLGPDNLQVRVLRVADGGEVASLDPADADPSIQWVAYSGSWVGDHVVAPASAGLVVFRVGAAISVEQVLTLDQNALPAGVQEPVFADESASVVVATADLPPRSGAPAETAFLECDRLTRSCLRGDPAPARDWLRLVRDPSRPAGGTP